MTEPNSAPVPAKKGVRLKRPTAQNTKWAVSNKDNSFVSVVVTNEGNGTSVRYRVRREPLTMPVVAAKLRRAR